MDKLNELDFYSMKNQICSFHSKEKFDLIGIAGKIGFEEEEEESFIKSVNLFNLKKF